MNKKYYRVAIVFACLALIGCSSSISGKLVGFNKEPVSNTLVKLIVIDDKGDEVEDVSFTITDGKGNFDFSTINNLGSSFVAEAVLPEGRLRGFACGSGSKTDLNPVTNAIVQAVLYVTEGGSGVTLSDFSSKELEEIVKEVGNSNDLWNMDFNGRDELVLAVIKSAGMLIPEAAGGAVSAMPLADVSPPDLVTDPGPVFATDPEHECPRDHYWLESSFFGFDILQDGALCKAESDSLGLFSAYGIAYQLRIGGDVFTDTLTGEFPGDGGVEVPAIVVEDEREVVFGPVSTEAGLSVTRKVYIPESGDFARYLEIISNPTAGDITIDVKIMGELGLGEFAIYGTGISTLFDQSGNYIIDEEDAFGASVAATPSTPHPAVGYVWDGLDALDGSDLVSFPPSNLTSQFDYWWEAVTIPAGGAKVFMHYSYLFGTRESSVVEEVLEEGYRNPEELGMSATELNNLQNFPQTLGNVTGAAGSVPGYSEITVTNETQPDTATATARRNGAFSANVDSVAGDSLKIEIMIDGTLVEERDLTVQ